MLGAKVSVSDESALVYQNSSADWPHAESETMAFFIFGGNL